MFKKGILEPMAEKQELSEWYHRELRPLLTADRLFPGLEFRNGRACCPLHKGDNKTAFSWNQETMRWTCWTNCGSGDALDYLAGGRQQPGQFVDLLRQAAELAGVDLPDADLSHEAMQKIEAARNRRALLEDFLALCKATLAGDNGEAARAYLVDARGFPADSLDSLPVGLCPAAAAAQNHLTGRGHGVEEIRAALIPSLEGRLVIGLRDYRGNLVSCAGRDMTGKAERKYLYLSGGLPQVIGLDHALAASREAKEGLVLVEGLPDMLALWAHGLDNVTALGGNSFNEKHADHLAAAGVLEVTLAMDADAGGESALRAFATKATNTTKFPKVSIVPPRLLWEAAGRPQDGDKPAKVDPDSLVREHGLQPFLDLLRLRQSAGVFCGLEQLGDVTPESPDAERTAAAVAAMGYAAKLRGPLAGFDLEDLLAQLAERTGYAPATLSEFYQQEKENQQRAVLAGELDAARRALADGKKTPVEVVDRLARDWSVPAGADDVPPAFCVEGLLAESRETPDGLKSGWVDQDKKDVLGITFNPRELVLVAARTSHGKTSALVTLANNWLGTSDPAGLVLFYSHEEPTVRVFHRFLAAEAARQFHKETPANSWAGFQGGRLWSTPAIQGNLQGKNGIAGEGDGPLLQSAIDAAKGWQSSGRLQIIHKPRWTAEQIRAHARGLGQPVAAVFVDYLQRLPVEEKADRRDIQISASARQLKELSEDLACPVIAGTQINKDAIPKEYAVKVNGAGDWKAAKEVIRKARPELHHLREGGSEQEADLVLGLLNYRADCVTDEDHHWSPPDYASLLEIGILKNRFGNVGTWSRLAFVGRSAWIRAARGGEEL
jgi:DNA primase